MLEATSGRLAIREKITSAAKHPSSVQTTQTTVMAIRARRTVVAASAGLGFSHIALPGNSAVRRTGAILVYPFTVLKEGRS